MKTAIFGGAFNPIHKGHIRLALRLKEIIEADRVLFIPSFISPHKSSENLIDSTDRINMVRLAIEGIKGFEVSDIEVRKKDVSYTVDTLKILHADYPEDDFFLFVGADMYLNLDRWYMADRVMSMATICTVPRLSYTAEMLERKKLEYDAEDVRSMIVDMPVTNVSSSEIRRGEKLEYLDKKVLDYINEHKLYWKN